MLIGLIGAPSSGKSTFFKACTLASVDIANYPFTTIKPNKGNAFVSLDCIDKEFDTQCTPREGYCVQHKRFIPVELMDVAGLVPNAHEGKGMGNEFLNNLAAADILIHVVDVSGSTNDKGEPVQPLSHDPAINVNFIESEINLWYLSLVKKGWDKFARALRGNKELYKAIAKQLSGLKVSEELTKEILRDFPEEIEKWNDKDLERLSILLRQKSKPIIVGCNKIDIEGSEDNLINLKKKFKDIIFVPCSSEFELALREANKAGLIEYVPGSSSFNILKKEKLNEKQLNALNLIEKFLNKFGNTGVQNILNKAVFDILKYKAIFPGGVNNLIDSQGRTLPDCFLLEEKATALEFAFRLHTDIGNGFIKAIDVKRKIPVGKDYILKNRDIIEIKTNN